MFCSLTSYAGGSSIKIRYSRREELVTNSTKCDLAILLASLFNNPA